MYRMIICHWAILHYNLSFKTIAGRSDGVFWWFPALSEDQEKICRIHQNYLVALKPEYLVLGDSSIFQKVQHSHSRHQKTPSNLLRINSNNKLMVNKIWPLEGALYINRHNSMVRFSRASRKCNFYAIFSKYWWFQTKRFTPGAFRTRATL